MFVSIEEIAAVYGGFSLKANCLVAGTDALRAREAEIVQAPVMRGGEISFTVVLNDCFDDEQLLDMAWDQGFVDVETAEEAREVIPEEAEMVCGMKVRISVTEDGEKQIVDEVNWEFCALDQARELVDWEVELDDIDEEYALSLIETFLDAAVDAE